MILCGACGDGICDWMPCSLTWMCDCEECEEEDDDATEGGDCQD